MFLYFVPGRHTLGREQLAGLGLGYMLDAGSDFSTRDVPGAGPSGGSGVVFASVPPDHTGHVKVDLGNQVWRQVPGSEAWVGHYKDRRPTPDNLARTEQLPGHWLKLLDGSEWLVPIARDWIEADGDCRWRIVLPRALDLAADGRWTYGPVVARYQPLWELTEAWISHRCGKPQERFADQGDINAAVYVLQQNYRLGRVEAAMLGILRDELVAPVLDCLIDWPTWLAYCKKKTAKLPSGPSPSPDSSETGSTPSQPAGSDSNAGPAASIPATAPPAPT